MNIKPHHSVTRRILAASLLSVVLATGCASTGGDSSGNERPDYEPIREAIPLAREPAAAFDREEFVGEAVVEAPLEPYIKPENPHLDATGSARIHNDSFNTGTYRRSGLIGPSIEVSSTRIDPNTIGVCPTLVFDKRGFVYGSCIVGMEIRLVMLDPDTMNVLAEQSLGSRPLTSSSAGGGYMSFDEQGRFLIGTAAQQIERWRIEEAEEE